MPYPLGVHPRRQRPRRPKTGAGGVAGAVIGGLFGGPLGVLAGGVLGHGGETAPPFTIEDSLRAAFAERGVHFVQLYRHGPFRIEAVFLTGAGYWSVVSTAPRVQGWTQIDLDDWLYGDLIDYQFEAWRRDFGGELL